MIKNILVALVWFVLAIIGLAIFVVMIPFILIAFIIAFILGLFGKSTFRVWTMKARKTADTVKAKTLTKSTKKPVGKVVDAQVEDVK
ncbi:MAG TPA: hypothetical protein VK158_00575 [Acidobacteriota bacterium]|nr:hypothetical protein [Acidobacteriota bacterium]